MQIHIIDKRRQLPRHPNKKYRRRTREAIKQIIIHHSGTKEGSPESFARYHVNHHGWPGIGYHYVIDKKGRVFHCQSQEEITYHTANHNQQSIGVCLIGDFTKESLTDFQKKAVLAFIRSLSKERKIPIANVRGHNEYKGHRSSLCPGISMEGFRGQLRKKRLLPLLKRGARGEEVKFLQQALVKKGFDPKGIDGMFGPLTEKAVVDFQRANNLFIDGIVGSNTWSSLGL
ncbi:peptidoglycan recognition protein family protein [Bacillus sp. FJAT-44742]|uniref:peptidoglycan recognition protein family protein n=1 Tax=Bacillus sp. FJAT-44742 TaxID=2014005 RepID=UPI0018E1EC59|nr:N-acetylmuramoyl-L-alanine amidase [Bacillus sp. FJAT-44742]